MVAKALGLRPTDKELPDHMDTPPSVPDMEPSDPLPSWAGKILTSAAVAVAGSFFLPWVRGPLTTVVPAALATGGGDAVLLWVVPATAIALLLAVVSGRYVRLLGSATAGLTLFTAHGLLYQQTSGLGTLAIGGVLASLAALAIVVVLLHRNPLHDEPAFLRVNRKRKDTVTHWFSYLEDFNTSSDAFYAEVEQELAQRQIPDLEMVRKNFREGGIVSSARQYLRLRRRLLIYDICAAPFGTGFFFSYRVSTLAMRLGFLEVIVTLYLLFTLWGLLMPLFGFTGGFLVLTGLLFTAVLALRLTPTPPSTSFEEFILNLRVIGPVYHWLFQRPTFYQADAELMYLRAVELIVKRLAGDVTAAKGVKLTKQFETNNVLGGGYEERPKELSIDLASPIQVTHDAEGA